MELRIESRDQRTALFSYRVMPIMWDAGESRGVETSYRRTMKQPFIIAGIAGASLALVPLEASARGSTRALRLEPERIELRLGGTHQFRARGAPSRDAVVRWRVISGGGSVDGDGLYTAPAQAETPATAIVQAETDGAAPGEARVLIPAVRVRVQAERSQLELGEACRLRATVEGAEDSRVAWSVDGGAAHGAVSESGLYTTPDEHDTPATVVVRATSVADASKSAVATLRLQPVAIEVRPREARMRMGETRRFEAQVRGTRRETVRWSVVGTGNGSITPSGLYTPPDSMGTPTVVTVAAASEADPSKVAQARVTISEVGIKILAVGVPSGRSGHSPSLSATVYSVVRLTLPLDPLDSLLRFPFFRGRSGKIYVPLGGAYQFQAKVEGSDSDIRWSLEGGADHGAISNDGLYRTPDHLVTPQMVRIVAQSAADPGRRAVATLNIPPVYVEARKQHLTVPMGGAVQLEAQVHNAENDRIRWLVEGGAGRGTVSASGLFQPAEPLTTPTTVLVRAVSEADDSKSVPFEVSVPEVTVRLDPTEATAHAGSTLRLHARVRGAADEAVNWRLDPPLGTISAAGTYTPPADLRGEAQVQITATSAADPTKSDRAIIRVLPRR